ncbi:MAG: polyprenol monophosphomannose synthase [Candidatus Edwardsbacteria bacterium]
MKTLIITPTYNERENIREFTSEVLAVSPLIEMLIIDDNSPDGTGQILDELSKENSRIHVFHRPKKLGLGTAYTTGFKWALEGDYDYIFEMDADFSHDPKTLPIFLEKIKEYDLVIGSRYIEGVNVVNWPMKRLLLSFFANMYARIVTAVPIRDLTSGFKCYRREVLQAINLNEIHSNGYAFQIEMHYKVWHKGFRVIEIPIVFVERKKGDSKMSKKIIYEAAWMVWKLRLLSLLRRLN